VSSRGPGPDGGSDAADIVHVLARNLSDEVLQKCFPSLLPEQVRMKLLEAVQTLDPLPGKDSQLSDIKDEIVEGGLSDWTGKIKGKTLSLYTDGASRGNPGEAGAGISIVDEQGTELFSAGEYLGQCTNNEAEYRALLHGLANVRQFGNGKLAVFMDSELIVRQISGQYRVKNANLKPLFQESIKRLADFSSYQFTHVN
jgi:ribonuclease HI